jgi:hypothetical protein
LYGKLAAPFCHRKAPLERRAARRRQATLLAVGEARFALRLSAAAPCEGVVMQTRRIGAAEVGAVRAPRRFAGGSSFVVTLQQLNEFVQNSYSCCSYY